ncbi:MAG: DUF2723 domain-containing protein [Caldilineaceae bacterium]
MVKFFPSNRADRQLTLLLLAGVFGFYFRSLAPGLLPGDAGEFQTAAWRLGLAHPTGYPLYLLLGGGWQHLLALFGVAPAFALNLLSAIFGVVAVALLYGLMVRWLPSPLPMRRLTALWTALLLALNPTFWSQNLIAEVYTLQSVLVVGLLAAAYALWQPVVRNEERQAQVVLLGLWLGLALTHHATTLLLLPTVGLTLWQSRRAWWGNPRTWLLLITATGAPLLLYLYIPLRSGPGASPWYHQPLGDQVLTLYQNNWASLWAFLSGRSISVGFHSVGAALAQLPQAWLLWRLHFLLPGLTLAVLGLYVLVHQRNWPVLWLTVSYFCLQQIFNLFYAIGDILVYYIPLYLIAAIWAGFAVDAIGRGLSALMQRPVATGSAVIDDATVDATKDNNDSDIAQPAPQAALAIGAVLVVALFWLPLQLGFQFYDQLDQSHATGARERWNAIVAAQPPTDAVLVSNDRNEMVPLFYLQAVEGRLTGITGLFPLLAPDARFQDLGATVATALHDGAGRPVYLVKPMAGLEVRFALQAATAPLVQVVGPAVTQAPAYPVDKSLGPLQLLGYDWQSTAEGVKVGLQWQVQEPLAEDYTTTVQLFAANGDKVGQDDAPPGGVYYPTSLWKPGERLVEQHYIPLARGARPTSMLVGMYQAVDFAPLAEFIQLPLPN